MYELIEPMLITNCILLLVTVIVSIINAIRGGMSKFLTCLITLTLASIGVTFLVVVSS